MLNVVQQRMIEEALVEKEVYDAMLNMRVEVGNLLGTPVVSKEDTSDQPAPKTGTRKKNPVPDLDDLPVGKPPAWHPAAQAAQAADGTAVMTPAVTPPPSVTARRPSSRVVAKVTPPPSVTARRAAQAPPMDGMVPPEVFAVGDPTRDPNRKVASFIPETAPGRNDDDPFPQLGPKGRPLG